MYLRVCIKQSDHLDSISSGAVRSIITYYINKIRWSLNDFSGFTLQYTMSICVLFTEQAAVCGIL